MILKRLSIAAIVFVLLVTIVYLVCLWQTGLTVERQILFQAEQLNRSGRFDVEVTHERGWLSSVYDLVFRPFGGHGLPIPLHSDVQHGFFNAHFDVTLDRSAEIAAWFDQGIEPLVFVANVSLDPIHNTVSSSGQIDLALVKGQVGQTHVNLQPSQISWDSTPRVLEYSAKIGDLVLQSETDTLELNGSEGQLDGAFKPSKELGALISELTASFSFKHLFWQDTFNQESLKLENVALSIDQMIDAGRSFWSIGLGADQFALRIQSQEYPIEQPNGQLTLEVDEQAFAEFIARYNQLYEPSPYDVAQLLNPITQRGMVITLHDLSFEVLGEQARATAKWILDGFDASTALISPVVLAPVSTLDAQIQVPTQIAERLPEATQEELDHLLNQGIFVEDEDQFVSVIRFDRGSLTVNERPFSLLKM